MKTDTSTTSENTADLESPIKRGETTVDSVAIRKPKSGELRGLTLQDLLQLDVIALQKLIPRVSTPALTEPEVADLDPADLVQLGTIVIGFFVPKASNSPTA